MTDSKEFKQWYFEEDGEPVGPLSISELREAVSAGRLNGDTPVYGGNLTQWSPLGWVPELSRQLGMAAEVPPPPSARTTFHRGQLAHGIDFAVRGEEMQYVEIELDPEEAVIAEAGSMMYMEDGVQLETVFGDGRAGQGLFGKLLGAGQRLLTGESLFMTVFSNKGQGKRHVAFAAPYPGKIIPVNLAELGGEIICQKDAFLCAAKGVAVSVAFQKRIGVGLFGGEGFIMQRLQGDGLAFVHAGGSIHARELKAGKQLRVDTGCIVALEASVDYDIEYVGNIKSALFGGESFFYASLTGPGTVWLQSLPFSRLAGRIHAAAPQAGNNDKGEG
jgi:uncharacterized protein (TIGR00266 family)